MHKTRESLDFLNLVDAEVANCEDEWPSWVPCWSVQITAFTSAISSYNMRRSFDQDWQNEIYRCGCKASGDQSLNIEERMPTSILRLLGYNPRVTLQCLPIVPKDFVPPEKLFFFEENIAQLLCTMLGECTQHFRQLSVVELRIAFFAVTTICPPDIGQEDLDEALETYFTWLNQIDLSYKSSTCSPHRVITALACNMSVATLMPMPDRSDGHGKIRSDSKVYDYHFRLRCLLGRRLFITSSGLLGIGPASMTDEDSIVILFGGSVPYVLRPTEGEQWRFIDECYIHGIMKGEALEGVGEDEHEWFELV